MVRWRARYEIPENSGLFDQLATTTKKIDGIGRLQKDANKAYYKASQAMLDAATLSRSNDSARIPGYDELNKKLNEAELESIKLSKRICELWSEAEQLARQIEDVETRESEHRRHVKQRMQGATTRG